MKGGLVMDESEKYDGYNWHDVYAKEFEKLDWVKKLDLKISPDMINKSDAATR